MTTRKPPGAIPFYHAFPETLELETRVVDARRAGSSSRSRPSSQVVAAS
jgi:hypothetical protein